MVISFIYFSYLLFFKRYKTRPDINIKSANYNQELTKLGENFFIVNLTVVILQNIGTSDFLKTRLKVFYAMIKSLNLKLC